MLNNFRLRIRARLQPRALLDNSLVSNTVGTVLLLASLCAFPLKHRLGLRVSATRRLTTPSLQKLGQRLLRPWLSPDNAEHWRRERIRWEPYVRRINDGKGEQTLTTSLLLKEPGENGEKGVLYCSFEYNWMKLLSHPGVRHFFNDYLLVGASSWSPTDHGVLANLCGLSEDPVYVGISNISDIRQYAMFVPGIFPLPILACDWLDPADFRPKPRDQRDIDILMVSHFAPWKRHWLLFEALSEMPEDLRVVLIGRNVPGRTEKELRNEARAFGVRQELTIYRNLEIDEVMRHQCNAKVAVALSKREGSCVAVTEALFADTPVVMMNDAHVGSRAYIKEYTGRVTSRRALARTLTEMIRASANYAPGNWAIEHISAQASSNKLNELLKQHSLGKGKPWTCDIAPLCWRYVPRYVDPMDRMRMRAGIERLRKKHGIVLEEFVSEKKAAERKAS
ncbi:MAG: glycosyltransferase [Pseudohongiellaceae bacterium]